MPKTSKYIILISLFCVLASVILKVQAAEILKDTIKTEKKWFNGIRAEVDLSSFVKSAVSKDTYTFEGALQANILEKFFPVVEFGFAGADRNINNAGFKTEGFFGRAGLDFKAIGVNPEESSAAHIVLVGARLGMSPFTYDISNVEITDDYWNQTQTVDYLNNKTSALWFEIVGSIRVEIFKNVFMGWSVRMKGQFSETQQGQVSPWYIPGYGINKGSRWDFCYSIGYYF